MAQSHNAHAHASHAYVRKKFRYDCIQELQSYQNVLRVSILELHAAHM